MNDLEYLHTSVIRLMHHRDEWRMDTFTLSREKGS